MNETKNKVVSYYILLLPALVIYVGILIFPIGMSAGLSLTRWSNFQLQGFSGVQNYLRIFTDPGFYRALWNNIQIMFVSVLGQIPLGILLAYVLYRKFVKGVKFFEMMIFLPITISSVVVALLWNRIFSPVGIFPAMVRSITGNPDYVVTITENPRFAMVPILFVLLWMHTSLYMVMFLANMQRIPKSSLEAAKIDGAKEGTILWRIILPALSNVIFTSSIFAISGSLKSFDLIFAMTGGGPVDYTNVMSIYLYKHTFTYSNYGYGSAISVVIIILSVSIISCGRYIYGRFQKRFD